MKKDGFMLRHATMDMTEGKPLRLLSVFALPLLIGNIFQQAYNLADSMIVGQMLGANALAAVGATGSISFLFFSLFSGISGGCGIVTAQYFGARQEHKVRLSITNSTYITLASSLLTGIFAFLMVPTVLTWMGTPRWAFISLTWKPTSAKTVSRSSAFSTHSRFTGSKIIRKFRLPILRIT